jgi:hypothetical protein
MYARENDKPLTTEELKEENKKQKQEIIKLKSAVYDVEVEMLKYKNAFKMLVFELANNK